MSITGTQSGIVVNPAAADHFQVQAPDRHRAGHALTLTVTALDPYGNVDVNYQGTITFSSSDPNAVLPDDYTFTSDDQGVVTLTHGATLFLAGPQTITVMDVDTGMLTGSATIRVKPARADHFQLAAPDSSTAGQPFDVTVTALDPYGNVDIHYAGTITFTSSDAQAVLPADYTFTPQDQGVVTFTGGATLFVAGSQSITATDVDTGLVVGDATILVTPAAADHFQITAPTQRRAGRAFGVTITALDPYGNVDVNYAGTITFSSSDAQAILPTDYTFTTQDQGMVTFADSVTLFTVGSQTITATDVDTGLLAGGATVQVKSGPTGDSALTHGGLDVPTLPATATAVAAPSQAHVASSWDGDSGVREEAERDSFFAALAGDDDRAGLIGPNRRDENGMDDNWLDLPLV
jgi:hypothetical protein